MRSGHDFLDGALGALGHHHSLQVFCLPGTGQEKRSIVAPPDGAEQTALEYAALLWRAFGGESVPRIEVMIPQQEIERAMVAVGGGLGDDLDAPAAPARVFGRVGVVVDADFLNG